MSIAAEAEQDLRELLAIPANYKVLFLQGGATLQFAQMPMNLLRGKSKADYVAHRRVVEEGDRGSEEVLRRERRGQSARTRTSPTRRSSRAWKLDADAAYVHYCSQRDHRRGRVPLDSRHGRRAAGGDMSSHILSRPLDVSKFGLIYAGAQKNIGPAGPDDRHRARRPDRPGAAGHALGARLQAAGRRRLDAQHAAHLRDLHRRAWCSSG